MNEYWKRSGQIPAFGNWDIANEFPITQYFENARQAGLICYTSSSSETDSYVRQQHDYTVEFKKQVPKATRIRYRNGIVNETSTRKHGKVYHATEYPSKPMNDVVCIGHELPSKQLPKAVDEDLYKISPQLLRKTKRKKMFGFIFKCLLPCACVS
ncbi:unnamed protein product [Vicia faba]|uniref:RIN4 pathogenic type III effector avirulence factor Avr cleavage site domain-containing protein n=1 Tax=Vicia faba TaxID=3906 RepID=A0AAV1AZ90_VICFA|nr:unnamed protein product [Vicia faba]